MTFVTTDAFLQHFNLKSLDDLPDIGQLREEGLLDSSGGLDLAPRRESEQDE
jgi:chromosome segregation and condensation protein ScpB